MRIAREEVKGLDEVIATYSYPVTNLHPASVRRSLSRAMKRANEGPDCHLQLRFILKNEAKIPPEFVKPGGRFYADTCGRVIKGCVELCNPTITQEEAIAGDLKEIYFPLTKVKRLQVVYRVWEPMPVKGVKCDQA